MHVVVGVDPENRMYLLDIWRGQTSSDIWIEVWCDLLRKWRPARGARRVGARGDEGRSTFDSGKTRQLGGSVSLSPDSCCPGRMPATVEIGPTDTTLADADVRRVIRRAQRLVGRGVQPAGVAGIRARAAEQAELARETGAAAGGSPTNVAIVSSPGLARAASKRSASVR